MSEQDLDALLAQAGSLAREIAEPDAEGEAPSEHKDTGSREGGHEAGPESTGGELPSPPADDLEARLEEMATQAACASDELGAGSGVATEGPDLGAPSAVSQTAGAEESAGGAPTDAVDDLPDFMRELAEGDSSALAEDAGPAAPPSGSPASAPPQGGRAPGTPPDRKPGASLSDARPDGSRSDARPGTHQGGKPDDGVGSGITDSEVGLDDLLEQLGRETDPPAVAAGDTAPADSEETMAARPSSPPGGLGALANAVAVTVEVLDWPLTLMGPSARRAVGWVAIATFLTSLIVLGLSTL